MKRGGDLDSFKDEIDKEGVRMSQNLFVKLVKIVGKEIFTLKHYKISIKHVVAIHLLLFLILA